MKTKYRCKACNIRAQQHNCSNMCISCFRAGRGETLDKSGPKPRLTHSTPEPELTVAPPVVLRRQVIPTFAPPCPGTIAFSVRPFSRVVRQL